MPVPQLDAEKLLSQLNELKRERAIIPVDSLRMKRFEKDIDAIRTVYASGYLAFKAAYYGLSGDFRTMAEFAERSVRLSPADEDNIAFCAFTYLVTGFFTRARELLGRIDIANVTPPIQPHVAMYCAHALMFDRAMAINDSLEADMRLDFISDPARELLRQENISGDELVPMVDLMGEFLRERGLLASSNPSVYPDFGDRTLVIKFPVTNAVNVAELEWEFVGRLFEKLPNAPLQTVLLGFMGCGPDAH